MQRGAVECDEVLGVEEVEQHSVQDVLVLHESIKQTVLRRHLQCMLCDSSLFDGGNGTIDLTRLTTLVYPRGHQSE